VDYRVLCKLAFCWPVIIQHQQENLHMSRITVPGRDSVPPASAPLLDAVEGQLGVVPNLFSVLAKSPAALEGFLGLHGSLSKTLDVGTRESIALAVAEFNGCDYCLSAHAYLGQNLAKLDEEEVLLNRQGRSRKPRTEAALAFAMAVASKRGGVSDSDVAALRVAGFSDAEAVELVAHVALNVFTNYVNKVAETPVDFPIVEAIAA
jgi:uncharacterized peroxidase-related enzyme